MLSAAPISRTTIQPSIMYFPNGSINLENVCISVCVWGGGGGGYGILLCTFTYMYEDNLLQFLTNKDKVIFSTLRKIWSEVCNLFYSISVAVLD